MRRRANRCLSILCVLMSFTSLAATAAQAPPETAQQREARMKRWRKTRFGMFIHWGRSSLTGKELSWSRKGSKPMDVTGETKPEDGFLLLAGDEARVVGETTQPERLGSPAQGGSFLASLGFKPESPCNSRSACEKVGRPWQRGGLFSQMARSAASPRRLQVGEFFGPARMRPRRICPRRILTWKVGGNKLPP